MGIGPFRRDGRRARAWGIALGAAAATILFGGVALPLAYAMGGGTGTGTARGRAAIVEAGRPAAPPSSTAAGRTESTSTATTSASHGTSPTTLDAAVVAMAADAVGGGDWEAASDGGLFAAGTAAYYGSMGGQPLHAPVVGMAATPTGKGYWEVASDGGIFSFGTAGYYGSMGGKPLHAPVVGMAATPTGKGYWEVASDGGIFSFGDAGYYGSMGGKPLHAPVVGMAATSTGKGYWEVAADGAIFSFGTARYVGAAKVTAPARSAQPSAAPGSNPPASPGSTAPASPASNPPSTPTASPPAAPPASAAPSGNPYVPPSNPPANVAPEPAFTFQAGASYSSSSSLPCWQLGQSAWAPDPATPQCMAAEVAATDHARAAEGLPPLRLPSNYASLTAQEQLFVLTDIERVSRGEQPVAGLSAIVSQYAQQGAEAGTDPHFTFGAIPSSDWWGSNVVSGALNALDANYTWMYQDGYGGDNVDCTSPGASGCWGHRDNELTSNYGGTLVMGAGEAPESTGLETLSELLVVVADPADVPPLSYTWSDAVAAGAGG